jgi:hypothetical protein
VLALVQVQDLIFLGLHGGSERLRVSVHFHVVHHRSAIKDRIFLMFFDSNFVRVLAGGIRSYS